KNRSGATERCGMARSHPNLCRRQGLSQRRSTSTSTSTSMPKRSLPTTESHRMTRSHQSLCRRLCRPLQRQPRRPRNAMTRSPSTQPSLNVETLSEAGQMDFFACEEVIDSGWSTYVQVGLVLATIRDRRLYRGQFGNFQEYSRYRWDYGRRYVDQLISAA